MPNQVTDQDRVKILGPGLAGQAAQAKALRARQLEAAIDQASGGPPAGQPGQQPPTGMSQAQFSGYNKTPEQRLREQEALAAKLRQVGR